MKTFLIAPLLFMLCSCGEQTTTSTQDCDTSLTPQQDTLTVNTSPADSIEYSTGDEYAIYYLAIADTSKDYYVLDQKMYELANSLKLTIDTMNRHYDVAKNNIVLPDDADDEMYRGEYYPRRYEGDFLSLELLEAFTNNKGSNGFALIAGIYDNPHSADSMLRILKPKAEKAYVSKASLYIGCMH